MPEVIVIDRHGHATVTQTDPLDDARIVEDMMNAMPGMFSAAEVEHNRKVIAQVRAERGSKARYIERRHSELLAEFLPDATPDRMEVAG